jgi:hypothetical protein
MNDKLIYNFADINVLNELQAHRWRGLCRYHSSANTPCACGLNSSRRPTTSPPRHGGRHSGPEREAALAGLAESLSVQTLQYVLRYTGKLIRPSSTAICGVSTADGAVLRLKDAGRGRIRLTRSDGVAH